VMECYACGRALTNDLDRPNTAHWTLYEPRVPYCADSEDCRRDTERAWVDLRWGVPPLDREWHERRGQ
jgi:hypothetical protein